VTWAAVPSLPILCAIPAVEPLILSKPIDAKCCSTASACL
jgi:hypothetical protein